MCFVKIDFETLLQDPTPPKIVIFKEKIEKVKLEICLLALQCA